MKAKPAQGVGILIERAMKERKMNRKEVATAVGVTVAALGRWITGARSPGAHQAKLMQVLGLSVDNVAASVPTAPAIARDAPGRWKR